MAQITLYKRNGAASYKVGDSEGIAKVPFLWNGETLPDAAYVSDREPPKGYVPDSSSSPKYTIEEGATDPWSNELSREDFNADFLSVSGISRDTVIETSEQVSPLESAWNSITLSEGESDSLEVSGYRETFELSSNIIETEPVDGTWGYSDVSWSDDQIVSGISKEVDGRYEQFIPSSSTEYDDRVWTRADGGGYSIRYNNEVEAWEVQNSRGECISRQINAASWTVGTVSRSSSIVITDKNAQNVMLALEDESATGTDRVWKSLMYIVRWNENFSRWELFHRETAAQEEWGLYEYQTLLPNNVGWEEGYVSMRENSYLPKGANQKVFGIRRAAEIDEQTQVGESPDSEDWNSIRIIPNSIGLEVFFSKVSAAEAQARYIDVAMFPYTAGRVIRASRLVVSEVVSYPSANGVYQLYGENLWRRIVGDETYEIVHDDAQDRWELHLDGNEISYMITPAQWSEGRVEQDLDVLLVTGLEDADGEYVLENASAENYGRVWRSSNNHYISWNNQWEIRDSEDTVLSYMPIPERLPFDNDGVGYWQDGVSVSEASSSVRWNAESSIPWNSEGTSDVQWLSGDFIPNLNVSGASEPDANGIYSPVLSVFERDEHDEPVIPRKGDDSIDWEKCLWKKEGDTWVYTIRFNEDEGTWEIVHSADGIYALLNPESSGNSREWVLSRGGQRFRISWSEEKLLWTLSGLVLTDVNGDYNPYEITMTESQIERLRAFMRTKTTSDAADAYISTYCRTGEVFSIVYRKSDTGHEMLLDEAGIWRIRDANGEIIVSQSSSPVSGKWTGSAIVVESGDDLEVSGLTDENANGVYSLVSGDRGVSRVWTRTEEYATYSVLYNAGWRLICTDVEPNGTYEKSGDALEWTRSTSIGNTFSIVLSESAWVLKKNGEVLMEATPPDAPNAIQGVTFNTDGTVSYTDLVLTLSSGTGYSRIWEHVDGSLSYVLDFDREGMSWRLRMVDGDADGEYALMSSDSEGDERGWRKIGEFSTYEVSFGGTVWSLADSNGNILTEQVEYAENPYDGEWTVGTVESPFAENAVIGTVLVPYREAETLWLMLGKSSEYSNAAPFYISIQENSISNVLFEVTGSSGSSHYTGFYRDAEGRLLPSDLVQARFYASCEQEIRVKIEGGIEIPGTGFDVPFDSTSIVRRLVSLPKSRLGVEDEEFHLTMTVQDEAGNTAERTCDITRISRLWRLAYAPLREESTAYSTELFASNYAKIPKTTHSEQEYTRSWDDIFYPESHGYPLGEDGRIDYENALRISKLVVDETGKTGPTTAELERYDRLQLTSDGTGLALDAEDRPLTSSWDRSKVYEPMTSASGSSMRYWVIDNSGYADFQLEFEYFDLDNSVANVPPNLLSPYDGDCLVVYDASKDGALEEISDQYGNRDWRIRDSSRLTEIFAFTGSAFTNDITMRSSVGTSETITRTGSGFIAPQITTTSRICLVLYSDNSGQKSGFKLKAGPRHLAEYPNYELDGQRGEAWVHREPGASSGHWYSPETLYATFDHLDEEAYYDCEHARFRIEGRPGATITGDVTIASHLGTDGSCSAPVSNYGYMDDQGRVHHRPLTDFALSQDDCVDYLEVSVAVTPTGIVPDYASIYNSLLPSENFGKVTSGMTQNKDKGIVSFTETAPLGRLFASYTFHTYYRLTNDGYGDLYFYSNALVPSNDYSATGLRDWTYVDLMVCNEGSNSLSEGIMKFMSRGYVDGTASSMTVTQVVDENRPWDIQSGTIAETVNATGANFSTSYYALPEPTRAAAVEAITGTASGGVSFTSTMLPRSKAYIRLFWSLAKDANGNSYVTTTRGKKLWSSELSGRYFVVTL